MMMTRCARVKECGSKGPREVGRRIEKKVSDFSLFFVSSLSYNDV